MKKKVLFVFSIIILLGISLYSFKVTNFPHRVSKLLHKIADYLGPKNLDPYIEKLLSERKYMILRDLGLSFEDHYDVHYIARELRNKIYQNNWKSEKINNSVLRTHIKYNYIFANKSAFTCGNSSVVYQWALDAFDIPSRTVQLAAQSFLDGHKKGDTHVFVEVFDGVKWFVSDPTFNAEYYCSNGVGPLSTKEMKNCVFKGNKLVPKYGKTIVPDKTIETYYIPIETLLYAYVLRSTVVKGKTIPAEEHPFPGWITASTKKYPPRKPPGIHP